MNRFSTLVAGFDENTTTLRSSSDKAYLDDTNSSSLYNHSISDSESISDDSKKIRKKRNTYQRIDDEIRIQLLELVQNGETLKAAAKRFNVNYSSAKSVLHTYRKEGRITKKSAQERVTKKRSGSPSDSDSLPKPSKMVKKENVKIIKENDSLDSFPLYAERTTSMTTCASLSDESSPVVSSASPNDNLAGHAKVESYAHPQQEASTENQTFHYPSHSHYREETAVNTMTYTPRHQGRLFDGFFGNHTTDFHYPEVGNHYTGDFVDYTNPQFFHEPTSFHFDHVDSSPFKSFIDTQNQLREAFRKASFSYTGRKNSFDLF